MTTAPPFCNSIVAFVVGPSADDATQLEVRTGGAVVRAIVAAAVRIGVGLGCAAPLPQAAARIAAVRTKVPFHRPRLVISVARVIEVDDRVLYYAAGIVDGEGCVSINKYTAPRPSLSPRYTPLVFVGNTQRPLVDWLLTHFGGTIQTRPGNSRHRACFIWVLHSRRAGAFVETLRPHLMLKGQQADVLLQYYATYRSFRGGSHKRERRISQEERARREALYQRVKALNKTGPRPGSLTRR